MTREAIGQRQRIVIARALAMKPAVLIIPHDLRVAARICDSVAARPNGKVVESGPSGRVFGDPQHGDTRALFAAAPGRGRLGH